MKQLYALLVLWLLLGSTAARAQPEARNWRFGSRAGLVFPASGPPAAVLGSALDSREACAVASDASGSLLCYASGEQVWDRFNAPMPNGTLQFGHNSATQGALLVPSPGHPQAYYLFTVDAQEHELATGLHYSIVDMSLRGGLGDIGPVKEVAVPLPGGAAKLTEKLTAVLLPNGRDYWIVVHGWDSDAFYSFLLGPAGLQAVPVVSRVGAVHRSVTNPYDAAAGYMRASPDGRRLAVAQFLAGVELFDFEASMGQVACAQPLGFASTCYGLEFSADGTKLYVSENGIFQIDLANRYAVARAGTGLENGITLLRGPDGRIYVSHNSVLPLSVIPFPNVVGAACGYLAAGQALAAGTRSWVGLPNFAGGVPAVRVVLEASGASCVGAPAAFSARLVPAAATTFTWDFGDPAAGAANVASGPTASHVYAAVGSYVVTVTAATATGPLTARQVVQVVPRPVLHLAAPTAVLCSEDQPVLLQPNAQPAGTTYRWQDGATTPTYLARHPGTYRLEVSLAAGCLSADSVVVRGPQAAGECAPVVIPNIMTPNGDGQNDFFVLQGLLAADWQLTVYSRWGRPVFRQASYDNRWEAAGQPAGAYYYLLQSAATGRQYRGWVEVVK